MNGSMTYFNVRIRVRQSAMPDDANGQGVLTPVFPPRFAQRLRAHPSLRFTGESISCPVSGKNSVGFEIIDVVHTKNATTAPI